MAGLFRCEIIFVAWSFGVDSSVKSNEDLLNQAILSINYFNSFKFHYNNSDLTHDLFKLTKK